MMTETEIDRIVDELQASIYRDASIYRGHATTAAAAACLDQPPQVVRGLMARVRLDTHLGPMYTDELAGEILRLGRERDRDAGR
jgi:hypothetical protein